MASVDLSQDALSIDPERTIAKITRRLIPFLVGCFFAAYLDRVNIGFAALTMNKELGFTPEFFGWGAGVFFLGYCLFEAPSNYILHRVGARVWIARIMVTWGIISALMAFVTGGPSFIVLRLLLGIAEAGFAPGVILYLTYWMPPEHRARILAGFLFAVPLSSAAGAPLSSLILASMDGVWGFSAWRWLFLIESIPTLLLGVAAFFVLDDRPKDAAWLSSAERAWLQSQIEEASSEAEDFSRAWRSLRDCRVLALGCVYFGVVASLYGLSFWLPQIVAAFGYGAPASAGLAALPYVVGVVAMAGWSRSSDRSGEHIRHTVIAAVIATLGLVASAAAASPFAAMIALSVAAIGTLGALPVIWSLSAGLLIGVDAAVGLALINSIGNIAGFVAPYVVGWLKTTTGDFSAPLLALALGPAFSAGLLVWMGRSSMLGAREPSESTA